MNYNDATGPRSSRARAVRPDEADEQNFPNRYRIAWSPSPADPWSEREEFLAGIDLILEGVQALIDRVG